MHFIVILAFLIAATSSVALGSTVSRSEFCVGCKISVYTYIQLMSNELEQLYKLPDQINQTIDPDHTMDALCENESFQFYKEYVKTSCNMIRDEHREKFLNEFTGYVTLAMFRVAIEDIAQKVKVFVVGIV